MQRIRNESVAKLSRAEARRAADVKALADKTAAEVSRLKQTYADREIRAAQEKAEAERILQRAARERDADLERHHKILAEKEAEITRQKRA